MPRIPDLRRVFRLDVLSPRVEREVDDELRFHFAETVAALVADGMTPERARVEAERRFGEVPRYREELEAIERERRDMARRAARWEAVVQDLRHAVRGLARRPGFTLAVVVTLALGIGANATMFGIIDRLLFRPPAHVAAPEELVRVGTEITQPDGDRFSIRFSYPNFRDLRDHATGLVGLAAFGDRQELNFGTGERARPVTGAIVTGDFLPLLGVRPVLGRLLQPADDTMPGAPPVVVLGHGFWQRAFGGSPAVVGTTIRLDQASYTIVGVAPPDFRGLYAFTPDVWLPLGAYIDASPALRARRDQRGSSWLSAVGRLDSSTTAIGAAARLTAALHAVDPEPFVRGTHRIVAVPVLSRDDVLAARDARVALLLAGVSVLLLLVACASVTNLLLARGLERGREIAVRLALGISRRRLMLQLLVESVLLAAAGGLAALAVVRWGGTLLQIFLLGESGATERPVDERVLAFTAAVALGVGVLVGLAPALRASRPALTGALCRGAGDGGGRRARTRATLIALQTALCVVLLVGTGLFVRSLQRVQALPPGVAAEQTLTGTMELRDLGYTPQQVDALFAAMAERVRALPGVRSTAVGVVRPLAGGHFYPIVVPGYDPPADDPEIGSAIYPVTPEYFATVGTRLLRGRGFTAADGANAAPVAIVSERMARHYWPGADPIGRCIELVIDSVPCLRVVGVAEETHAGSILVTGAHSQYYVPLAQAPSDLTERVLFVRPEPGARQAVAAAVRLAMQGAAPGLPFAEVAPLADLMDGDLRPWRLGATLFAIFGALALVVAAVGLYGVLAFGVAQRRHELGVRMALGATDARVRALVVREGLVVAGAGTAAGVLLA
ncbi:MAG TPA: ADOP family duplicated permease, partial [Gemmatimonadaceae bacterium]|nr:ADOP family duplicated permease [Gemmatimonadaceae bacterium]